jgi:hypothetical protein
MKGKLFFTLNIFLAVCTISLSAQTVAVADWTASDPAIQGDMTAVTDVFRAQLMENTLMDLADGSSTTAPYTITGTVTRFGDWSDAAETAKNVDTSMKASDMILPLALAAIPGWKRVPRRVRVFGMVLTVGAANKNSASAAEKGAEAQEAKDAGRHGTVSASMKERATGRILASAVLDCHNYADYTNGIPDFAAKFTGRMPLPDAMKGVLWQGTLEHDGWTDDYSLTMGKRSKCALTVESKDSRGNVRKQSAEGRYRYRDGILSVNVDFHDRATITWLTRVNWKFIADLSADSESWDAVVPVSSSPGAKRMRITFWRAE